MRTKLIFSIVEEKVHKENITIHWQFVSAAGRYEFFISSRDWNFVSLKTKS